MMIGARIIEVHDSPEIKFHVARSAAVQVRPPFRRRDQVDGGTCASTPLTEIPGLPAPLAVGSPEATALDLIAFSHRLGGIERGLEVIQGREGAMTGTGMRSAFRAGVPVTVLQRIGCVFETLEKLRKRGAQLVGEVVRYKGAYRLCDICGPEGLLIVL